MNITREYLQYLESEGEGKINWDVWDRTVAETRKWIEENVKYLNLPKDKIDRKKVIAYNSNGEFEKEWTSNAKCTIEMKCSVTTIHTYSKNNGIVNGLLLSREELTKDQAFATYRYAIEHGKVFQTGITTTKPKKIVYRYTAEGKMVGVYESVYQYCKVSNSTDSCNIKKRMSNGDIVSKGYLLSYNFYDEPTARKMYTSIKKR